MPSPGSIVFQKDKSGNFVVYEPPCIGGECVEPHLESAGAFAQTFLLLLH